MGAKLFVLMSHIVLKDGESKIESGGNVVSLKLDDSFLVAAGKKVVLTQQAADDWFLMAVTMPTPPTK